MAQKVFLSILGALLIISCGKENNGGGFGKPSQPLLDPSQAQYPSFTQQIELIIDSNHDIRYSHGVDELPVDPNCVGTGNVYSGPFLIGGPDETINIKAIACNGGLASQIASGQYVFGP
ncbi:MAG TPA: hypothetical protein PKC21_09355 [Oligoflexia bacterium]|nr:hypothetical protein [Oligoflexia bacterium]HMR25543.1 hypothetical protein [Oligoflexia bacterium]